MEPVLSHPGVPLVAHLRRVGEEARRLLDHPALRDRERLATLAYLAGIAHDFGKATSFFQRHLRGERVRRGLHRHSLISALFGAYLAWHRFPDDPVAPLIVYLAVHRHHGALYAPERTWPSPDDEEILEDQWADLSRRKTSVRALLREVWDEEDAGFLNLSLEVLTRDFVRRLRAAYRQIRRGLPITEDEPDALSWEHARHALHTQLVFSALISADKFAAASLERPERLRLAPDLVEAYRSRFSRDTVLGVLRDRLQRCVLEALQPSELPGVFTLTAPTGSGKTLAAFQAGLRIRQVLEAQWGVPPRVIYALPFINLIEQVESVLRDVLLGHPDCAAFPERFLVAHHHLAPVQYREDAEERPLREALLLVEGWESEVVVTTFVQVFHTVFGYENRFLKKLHNLVGSVLILDEPQQFPPEYWKALGWMVALLREEMGVSVLLMTATQPRILEGVPHRDLVSPQVQKDLRRHLNRYTVVDLRGEGAFREALEEALEAGRKVLVVVNTIRTSLELWRAFQDMGVDRAYLSTNILPLHRKERVLWLKQRLKEPEPLLVISTQVVEAGVDLDFDVVFRELSPLDALIQSAGRCNREGQREQGWVYRFTLEDSLRRGGAVYGRVAMAGAREVWTGEMSLDEEGLAGLLEAYYAYLMERGSQDLSRKLWYHYARMAFSDPRGMLESLRDYPLIAYRGEIPVLVMLSEEDEARLEAFREEVLEEREDWGRRQEAYLRHRVWLHERTLRLLPDRVQRNLPPAWAGTGFRWVPHDQVDAYYDPDTGFRWTEEDLEGEVWVL